MEATTLAKLFQRSAPTDRRAEFERLAQPHQREIFNAALRMTGHREDAEDLAQEAFVRAFTHLEQFEPGTNFRAWLFRILVTTYINQYRKKSRTPEMLALEDLTPNAEYLMSADNSNGLENPEEALLATITDDEVQSALSSLSDEFRTVVILSDLQELSYQEIADALQIPIGTVRSRLSRGRSQLRRKLMRYAKERRLI
ncbi:MAG: sigma-70 family RNA polymerase sigma factor [Abditibacteriales bacterium]|nr:sigma-70 family RNA polymerase sigma factor [Abditibacteriales bacterium]MDW8365513.1 sigma-70 family RNA polymerase sigma factor [Abditibacteriales bacterium]